MNLVQITLIPNYLAFGASFYVLSLDLNVRCYGWDIISLSLGVLNALCIAYMNRSL